MIIIDNIHQEIKGKNRIKNVKKYVTCTLKMEP